MKSEPKAFASLSSGLLARKGAARPAMRPQGFGQATGNLDDLGWNDMGFDPPKPSSTPLRDIHAAEDAAEAARLPFAGLTPLDSPVHSQQAEIVDRLSAAEEAAEDFEEALELETSVPAAFESELHEEPEPEPEPEPYVRPVSEQRIASFAPPPEHAPQVEPAQEPYQEPAAPAVAVGKTAPTRAPKVRSAPGTKARGKAAFTLRLDSDRHLKLRLACALGARSAQHLVTDALDQFLAAMPELDAMAEKAKPKGS